jgi:hypothetical protein
MSTLATTNPTLIDVSRVLDPQGKVDKVVNVLQQYNDILDDIVWMEGNLPTGHLITVQTSKPTPYFRLLNQGIVPQKATTGQITEACGIMENRNQIDVNIAKLNGNLEAFRASQDKPMIEGFSDLLATKLIYGDSSVTPEEFNGLATRYFSLGSTYTTSANVIDGGGTGSDNTSIWLVCWGEDKVYGIYPKGSKAGLDVQDLGIQEVTTNASTGARMRAYETWMQWQCGLAVADWRYVVRICNIDISNLQTAGDGSDTSANILKLMIQALGKIPPRAGTRPVFYMNETVQSMLAVKLLNKSNVWLSMGEIKNTPIHRPNGVLQFMGVPCRRIDAITSTESQITTATT